MVLRKKKIFFFFVIVFPSLLCNTWHCEVQLSTFFFPLHKYLGAAFFLPFYELKWENLRAGPRAPSTGNHRSWPQHHPNRRGHPSCPVQNKLSAKDRGRSITFFPNYSIQQRQWNMVFFAFRCCANIIAILGWLQLWLHHDLWGSDPAFIHHCNSHPN